jgi:hypothetical protein
MRWTRRCQARKRWSQGGFPVSGNRRADERHRLRTAKSCGPDAPLPASSLVEVHPPDRVVTRQLPQGDGVNKAWSPGRARRKPLKPLRRESRTASAEPVCSCAFCYVHLGTRDRGCSAHPAFPAPSSFLGAMFMQTSGAVCRENAESYSIVAPATGSRECAPDDRLSIPRRRRWNRELAAYLIPAFAGMTAVGEIGICSATAETRRLEVVIRRNAGFRSYRPACRARSIYMCSQYATTEARLSFCTAAKLAK